MIREFDGQLDVQEFTGELDTVKEFTGALDGEGWGDVIRSIPTQMRESVNLGMAGIQRFANEIGRDEASIEKFENLLENEDPRVRDFAKNELSRIQKWAPRQAERVSESIEESKRARLSLEEATPENLTFWQQAVVDASRSLGVALPGLAGSLLTGSPGPALVTMGGAELGTSYNEAREFGLDEQDAGRFAGINSAIEVLTEAVPLGTLLKRGTPFMSRMLKLYGQELVGENLATVLQDANDFAMRNPDATLSDWHEGYVKARPEAAARTSAATVLATTVQGGGAGVVHSAMGKVREFNGELDAKEFTGELDRREEPAIDQLEPLARELPAIQTSEGADLDVKDTTSTETSSMGAPLDSDTQAEAAKVTETPEFKNWFGDSKVVDAEGKPLVVYHGSGMPDISVFDPSKAGDVRTSDWGKGTYFTPSKGQADGYREEAAVSMDKENARLWREYEDAAKKLGTTPMMAGINLGHGSESYNSLNEYEKRWRDNRTAVRKRLDIGQVYAAYLSLENPLDYTYGGMTDPFLAELAKSKGHDGIIIRHEDGSIDEIVAFRPEQIKSAIGNKGTFDPKSPRISDSQSVSAMPGSRYTGMLTGKALPESASPDIDPETVAEMIPKGDVSSVLETDKVSPMTPKRGPGTEDLTQQTPLEPESEEFKRWFGDSKVIDENGEPLVMYHGSEDVLDVSPIKGQLFFTTSSRNLAAQYTGYGDDFNEVEITGRVIPVFVNSGEYPLIIDANGATADRIPVSKKLAQEIDPERELFIGGDEVLDDIAKKTYGSGKYDSLIVHNVVMNGKTDGMNIRSTVVVTFYPDQIKSANSIIPRPESLGAPERAPPRTATESEQQTPSTEGVSALGPAIPGVPPKVSASTVSAMPGSRYTGMLTEKALPESAPPDKSIRREDIIRPLMKYMGVPLYQGRVKGKNRLGFFRHVVEEVRIKYHNDLEVTAHEIAHLIDDRYPEFKKAYRRKEFSAEVRGVSYDAKKLHEGFAEFMRLFMTQETEAVQRVPKFYDWFTKTLENHKLGPILREAQAKMHSWYSQGALKRAESKLGSPKVPLRHQFDALIENWDEKAKQEIFDALHGVKVAELALRGKIQDATHSPYKSLRLVAGSRGVIRSVFKHGTINWDAEGNIVFTGQGLEQILNPVADRLDKVQLYFAGRRAQELKSQGRENLFRNDEIKAMLDLGKDEAIRQAFQDWLSFNKRMMDFYQKSGIVSAEARSAMEEMNKNYVPFHRVYEEITGEKKTRGGSPFMRLKGGTANVNDIIDNITNSVSTLTHAALLNKAKQQAYDLIDGPGGARFAAKIPSEARVVNIDSEQLKDKFLKAITGMGLAEYKQAQKIGQGNSSIDKMLTLLESGIGDTVTFFTFGNAPKGMTIDTVMRNGKIQFYEVADPMFLKAMQSFGPQHIGMAMRVLNGFKNTGTRVITTLPDFQIPNLLRDSFMGYTLSKGGFVPVVDSIKGMKSRLTKDKVYWEFMANGGGFSSTIHGETLRKNLERFYTSRGFNYKTVLDTPQKLLSALDEFNSAFEYGTRLGEFKKLKAKGKSSREAAFGGREISTDFAMRGSSDFIKFFALTVPFFNARMQGLYRLGREMAPETRKTFVTKATLGIMLPTLLLYWMNKDDERYQALPDWMRDLHWIIFLPGSDTPLLIPKPFEVGLIFATIPERIVEAFEKRDGKKFVDVMLWNIGEALSLNPTPQIVRPIVDVARNRTFTGGPVIPEDLLDVEDFEQHRPWTSETLVELGKHTGLSPMKTEALLRGYLGTLGIYALMVTDSMIEDVGEKPTRRFDETPVIRRFFKDAPYRSTSYEKDFYELAEESRKAVATFRKILRENRPEEAESYLDEDKGIAFGLSVALNKMRSTVADINRHMRVVQNDREMSGQEKRKILDELMQQRNDLFKEAAQQLNSEELKKFRENVS